MYIIKQVTGLYRPANRTGTPRDDCLSKKKKEKKANRVCKFKRKLDSYPSPQSRKLETAQQEGSSGVQSWELEKQVFWVVNPTQC